MDDPSDHWGFGIIPPFQRFAPAPILGHSEWAIRLPGPFLHTLAAVFLFLTGRSMYSPRVGMFAAFIYALMPAVILSSGIISTDGILMPFWSMGLYCLWRLRNGNGRYASAIGLGAAIGIGFLSKYAMLYFGIGIGLALVLDSDTRRALLSRWGLIALVIAAAIFAPHVAWNMAHDFKTVSHTVDNANLGGDLLNPENALTFLADQMGVFGPISFLALLIGLLVMRSEDRGILGRDRLLLCFALPVLIIIMGQAVLSRANANWAATAYPAASILVASWLTRAKPNRNMWFWIAGLSFLALQLVPDMTVVTRLMIGTGLALAIIGYGFLVKHRPEGLLWCSLALHGVVACAFVALALLPADRASALGFDNALKRTKGWDAATAQVMALAETYQATAILVDEREVWHGFDYYAQDRDLPLLSWRRYGVPKSFAETQVLDAPRDGKVLIVSLHPGFRPKMRGDFETFEVVGDIAVPLGHRSNGCALTRRFKVYLASGHVPQARSKAWESWHDGLKEFPNPKCRKPATPAD